MAQRKMILHLKSGQKVYLKYDDLTIGYINQYWGEPEHEIILRSETPDNTYLIPCSSVEMVSYTNE